MATGRCPQQHVWIHAGPTVLKHPVWMHGGSEPPGGCSAVPTVTWVNPPPHLGDDEPGREPGRRASAAALSDASPAAGS